MEGLFESGSGVFWRNVAVAFAESYSRAFPGVSVPIAVSSPGRCQKSGDICCCVIEIWIITSVSVFSEFCSQSSDTCNGQPGSLFLLFPRNLD